MAIRKNLAVHNDPYLPWGGLRGMAICKGCGAVYWHKRWSMEGPPAGTLTRTIHSVLCPACCKVRDHFVVGTVTVEGTFWKGHREEILHLIRNQEARAQAINPLQRIIALRDQGPTMVIETTTERFAQRIGRELERAYSGKTIYHWSKGNKCIRVKWRR